jgi:GR25 family glycosyltransferase involved in LPS biosynthesis
MTLNYLTNNIYVINLKHREDRRNHIISELKKTECNSYEIIEAINGNELPKTTRLSKGALGLAKTYLKIYDKWKENNDGVVCLIEDDCVFLDNFNEDLKTFLHHTPKDWDILYFGGNHNYHRGYKTEEINPYCIKLNYTFSNHCLVMKNYVFEELITLVTPMELEVDVAMTYLQQKYNAYCTPTKITNQLVNYSDIENRVVDYNWLIK